MGRKLFVLLLQSIWLVCSCTQADFYSEHSPPFLSFPYNNLLWHELFAPLEKYYFVYIYSDICFHCLSIKKNMNDFALNSVYPVYFVEFSDDISIGLNTEETIGKNKVEECFIKGVPSLILIEHKAISLNIAGTNKILETIDLYRR